MSETRDPIRILLADQHALFRDAVRTVLEVESGLRVVAEARNGVEAVAEAERTLPNVAIIDFDLPLGDAPRTITMIKERVPDCRVLVLSAGEGYSNLIEVLDAGATGFVTKESPLAELINATRIVNRGATLVPPWMLGPLLTELLHRRKEQDRAYERIARLTRREREVLALLAEGADNGIIARTLVISPQTARTHIQNILSKLSVHSRLEAAAFVTRHKIERDLVVAER